MVGQIGRYVLRGVSDLLEISGLPYAATKSILLERGKSRRLVIDSIVTQVYYSAVETLPLFTLLGVILGFIVAVGAFRFLSGTTLAEFIPAVIVRAVVLELVPLLIALVVTGRSGTAVSTELGYMRVNQQISAYEASGINVEYFLVLPRVVGIALATVGLTTATSAAGLVGGVVLGRVTGFIGMSLGVQDLLRAMEAWLIGLALLKAVAFGVVIASVNCHYGLRVGSAFTEIPRANVRGAVACYLICFAVNAAISLHVLASMTPLTVNAP